MFFLIYGEDTFRSRRALRATKAKFCHDRDSSGLNTVRLTSQNGLERARNEIFASPFLAERKMLILEGFCSLPKGDQEELAGIIGRKPESTVVVFFEESDPKKLAKSPLFNLIFRQKYSREYRTMSPLEAGRSAVDAASEGGVCFESAALRKLTEAVESDSWRIHQETAKLTALVLSGKRDRITVQDVDSLVTGSREESVFRYIDACTDGNGTMAMTSLENLLAAGEPEIQVVSLLQRHFRLIALCRDMMANGTGQANAATRLGVHPFAAKKAWQAAQRYDSRLLEKLMRDLARIERGLKTGSALPKISLGLFTANLTAKICALKTRER
ncbi:DNA polymerase III subunit delta [Candidatus Uhrbacteria bacterium]|nr:DNA polymerase III subunit delta [Candidatus Uhrbacteria bacterium]